MDQYQQIDEATRRKVLRQIENAENAINDLRGLLFIGGQPGEITLHRQYKRAFGRLQGAAMRGGCLFSKYS